MSQKEMEQIILNYLKAFNLRQIGIFGSYARKQEQTGSDIDVLVAFKTTPSLLQLLKIENELSNKLGIKVDLVTRGAIKNKRIKNNIEKDIKIIFNA